MVEEDSRLDEQIRKKKRFVLLALFGLLLMGTLAALSLIAPTTPSSQAVAELEQTPTPEQLTSTSFSESIITPTPTSMAEATGASEGTAVIDEANPDQVQGDEWQHPGTPISNDAHESNQGTLSGGTPSATATVTKVDEGWDMPKDDTASTANPGKPNGNPITSTTTTESSTTLEENQTPVSASNEPLDINELPRVHESWGPTTGDEVGVTPSLAPITSLTHTTTMSETEVVIPPNGLPITGISQRHPLNWAAVALVILLLGTGIAALRHPGSR